MIIHVWSTNVFSHLYDLMAVSCRMISDGNRLSFCEWHERSGVKERNTR